MHPLPASRARSTFSTPIITTRLLNSSTGIVRILNASNQNRAYSSNASRVAWSTRASLGSAPSTRAWLAATVARTVQPSMSHSPERLEHAAAGSLRQDIASHSAPR